MNFQNSSIFVPFARCQLRVRAHLYSGRVYVYRANIAKNNSPRYMGRGNACVADYWYSHGVGATRAFFGLFFRYIDD